ncbi:hypothetical protein [Mycobacterium sp. 141]|uniref:hypothetical protein n=1 Tax=Mycobacterium sp. 141 TaxID=1120797 RepID=UPI000379B7F7|nr:hypothetical protein [Mycobacterium sp. 141]
MPQLFGAPVPQMQPPQRELSDPASAQPAAASPPGIAAAAAIPVLISVAVPPVVVPPGAPNGDGGSGAGSDQRPALQPTPEQRPPAPAPQADGHDHGAVPATYRAGYGEYLRTAGTPEIAALAVSGTIGIMALTGAGGIVGYRQARAGRAVRINVARFVE